MAGSLLLRLFARDGAAGLVLMALTVLALVVVNSPAGTLYDAVFSDTVRHVIDDGPMVVFFLLVSLEIKRELVDGDLASPAQRALPGFAALGGMAVPALVYLACNLGNTATLRGWAIPSATDIAFSLGVMSLLGRRVPPALRLFLTALAILDDLGAIVVIAVFYTGQLSWLALGLGVLCLGGLVLLNRRGAPLWAFGLVGLALWGCLLPSGLHATLAGVALGLALPLEMGHRLERRLRPWVDFGVVPLFAFANAGLRLGEVGLSLLGDPVVQGVVAGLFLGKQLGVFGSAWLVIRFTPARLPEGCTWGALYGAAVLTGIGFTMSLFIGALAFPGATQTEAVRFAVLAGSVASAVLGALVLRFRPGA